jgi:alkylhydroperoxidase family enzyme
MSGPELPPPPVAPRLTPLPKGEWDDFLTRLVDATGGPDHALNVFTTLGRHPELFRRWLGFGGTLLAGRLPARTRELAILRTSVHCRADYEWLHHVDAARTAGVTEEELVALRRPLDAHAWDGDTRTVLAAVDQMHTTWTLDDDTWVHLHALLDDASVIELVMLVGQYHLVALALRTLGVQPEHEAPALD